MINIYIYIICIYIYIINTCCNCVLCFQDSKQFRSHVACYRSPEPMAAGQPDRVETPADLRSQQWNINGYEWILIMVIMEHDRMNGILPTSVNSRVSSSLCFLDAVKV